MEIESTGGCEVSSGGIQPSPQVAALVKWAPKLDHKPWCIVEQFT